MLATASDLSVPACGAGQPPATSVVPQGLDNGTVGQADLPDLFTDLRPGDAAA